MNKIQEKSMLDALSYCDLRDIPSVDTKEYIWLRALALVEKTDGNKCYVLMEKNEHGKDVIKKDFGTTASIVNVIEIYPFKLLEAQFYPEFKANDRKNRIAWLDRHGVREGLEEASIEQLDEMILNRAIWNALNVKYSV